MYDIHKTFDKDGKLTKEADRAIKRSLCCEWPMFPVETLRDPHWAMKVCLRAAAAALATTKEKTNE